MNLDKGDCFPFLKEISPRSFIHKETSIDVKNIINDTKLLAEQQLYLEKVI